MLINVNQLFLMLHRLNNLKVTGGTHLGWGWGWVRQDHSQSHKPGPRSYPGSSKAMSRSLSRSNIKIILKVIQSRFKVKLKNC